MITLACSQKNKAEFSDSNTLFQVVFISGDPLVPGAEQDVFHLAYEAHLQLYPFIHLGRLRMMVRLLLSKR